MTSVTCTVRVTGNTHPHRAGLKRLGLKWTGAEWVGAVKRNQRFPENVVVVWEESESERDWRLFVEQDALSASLAQELFGYEEP